MELPVYQVPEKLGTQLDDSPLGKGVHKGRHPPRRDNPVLTDGPAGSKPVGETHNVGM